MLPVAALYAGLLGFGFILLVVRTAQMRGRYRLTLGTSHRLVERAVRAHGNFAEHAPFALLLLALCEANGLPAWALHALGVTLLVGRFCHAWGIAREPEVMRWRMLGMSLTLTMMGVAAAAALGLALAGL
ncbi:MAPEG family protein [Falsiroseomonas selenitidurans]|uniref:Glutathione metabolism protein n=1 Tax=Falsiroseomonas selenitidurans TaxID=2716335 RepID=A0ABX1EEE5_9PROT|nr:MAPEG family protein [Falsiroseomonas selenitidurans]NKC33907.1 glutathione metabolism protein [Falsiroseomonas selenitidurans]